MWHVAPKRVIEIGSGYSTHLIARAMGANSRDGDLLVVDSFPRPVARAVIQAGTGERLSEEVQAVGIE